MKSFATLKMRKGRQHENRPSYPRVTLTRRQVAKILLDYMGWEHVDVRGFWTAAHRAVGIQQEPVPLAVTLKERLFAVENPRSLYPCLVYARSARVALMQLLEDETIWLDDLPSKTFSVWSVMTTGQLGLPALYRWDKRKSTFHPLKKDF